MDRIFKSVILPDEGIDLKRTIESIEARLIQQALVKTRQNKAEAAKLLQINRTTLVQKIQRYKAS